MANGRLFTGSKASKDAGQSMHVHHHPIFLYSLFSWPGIPAVVLRLQSPSGQIEKEGTITSDERVLFVLSSTSLWTPVRFDVTVLRWDEESHGSEGWTNMNSETGRLELLTRLRSPCLSFERQRVRIFFLSFFPYISVVHTTVVRRDMNLMKIGKK